MARKPMIQGMKPAGELLALGSEAEARLTLDQQAFLQAAREWLKRASLVDFEPSASHEPRPKRLGGSTYPGVLWIVLKPIHQPARGMRPRGPHESVQLGMSWDGFIFGGWQGYPYVWEFEERGVPPRGRTVRTGGGGGGCFRVGRARTQAPCSFVAQVTLTMSFPAGSGTPGRSRFRHEATSTTSLCLRLTGP